MNGDRASEVDISLRAVAAADIDIFHEQQLDQAASRMAAFTSDDPGDRAAFAARWARMLDDETITARTIVSGGRVAGHIAKFLREGEPEVTYWLGRDFWGRGIATAALRAFLEETTVRPLHARAAADNVASIRVLEKCGFTRCGDGRYFSNSRSREVDEVIFVLSA